MKKLLLVLVAIFLATNVYALNETDQHGPQHITTCYIVGAGPVTSGNAVVLQTSSPTYYGAEVTGTATAGLAIHGVVVDTRNYTSEEIANGKWITVQLHGYCPLVKLATRGSVTANAVVGQTLSTSGEKWRVNSTSEVQANAPYACVSGDTGAITLESKKGLFLGSDRNSFAGQTIKAWLSW